MSSLAPLAAVKSLQGQSPPGPPSRTILGHPIRISILLYSTKTTAHRNATPCSTPLSPITLSISADRSHFTNTATTSVSQSLSSSQSNLPRTRLYQWPSLGSEKNTACETRGRSYRTRRHSSHCIHDVGLWGVAGAGRSDGGKMWQRSTQKRTRNAEAKEVARIPDDESPQPFRHVLSTRYTTIRIHSCSTTSENSPGPAPPILQAGTQHAG